MPAATDADITGDTDPRTNLHRAVETLLGQPLVALVVARRSEGASWRGIAREITDKTGVNVTHETLRSWCPDPEPGGTPHNPPAGRRPGPTPKPAGALRNRSPAGA